MSGFERNRISIKETVATYGRHAGDHGSAVAQVAILTTRIRYLTAHLQKHKKDKNTLRALQVSKRRGEKKRRKEEEKEREKNIFMFTLSWVCCRRCVVARVL